MKVVVINGTEVRGCTYNIKEIFLKNLAGDNEITEFYLPRDNPHFCMGCKNCFFTGEADCPHVDTVGPIWQALVESDLIVFAYPVYVLRTTGQVKALLDHFGCRWLVHRPEPAMFSKRAVILTQSIGAPNRAAQKDVKTSLSWLGVTSIKCLGMGMIEGVIWEELSEARRAKIETKVARFARGIKPTEQGRKGLLVRMKFQLCKLMQRRVLKKGIPSLDVDYWIEKGWLKCT
ncbi:MAG TPA: flavodoxin family protein [Clostridiaceae bacterium]|nr:flavodoxin family protein [Clostridiaceae bacterium]